MKGFMKKIFVFLILLLISTACYCPLNASPLYQLRNLNENKFEIADTSIIETEVIDKSEAEIPDKLQKKGKEDTSEIKEKNRETNDISGAEAPTETEPEDPGTKKSEEKKNPPGNGSSKKTESTSNEAQKEAPQTSKEETEDKKKQQPEVSSPPLPSPAVTEQLSTPSIILSSPPKKRVHSKRSGDTGKKEMLAAADLIGPSGQKDFFIAWQYILGGVFSLSVLIIIWWKRRPRSVTIYHDATHSKASEYFRDHFSRHVGQKVKAFNSVTSPSIETPGGRNNLGRGIPSPQIFEESNLKKLGIDTRYRDALRLYYLRGMNPERIARQTRLGSGEIGLVVDLTERLCKDRDIPVNSQVG